MVQSKKDNTENKPTSVEPATSNKRDPSSVKGVKAKSRAKPAKKNRKNLFTAKGVDSSLKELQKDLLKASKIERLTVRADRALSQQNFDLALKEYTALQQLGSAAGLTGLGIMSLKGQGRGAEDIDVGREILKAAVELGDSKAAFTLGDSYENSGIEYIELALFYYERAEELHDSNASIRIAEIHLGGRKAAQNIPLGIRSLELAAARKFVPAMMRLSGIYQTGRLVPHNADLAKSYRQEAVTLGYVDEREEPDLTIGYSNPDSVKSLRKNPNKESNKRPKKPVSDGDNPPPTTAPDLTTRGTLRKNALARPVHELNDPTKGRNHDINSSDAHFQSKIDSDLSVRFNKYCTEAKTTNPKRTKKEITNEALRDFLEKYNF